MPEESVTAAGVPYRKCRPEDVGIVFQPGSPQEMVDLLEKYFARFVAPIELTDGFLTGGSNCLCGRRLSGFLGTFTYSLIHGEGRCRECGAPARADHYVKDGSGEEFFALRGFPLLYHPDEYVKKP